MTWLRWVGFVAAIAAIKWVMTHRGEDSAAYIVAFLFAMVLLVGYLRHAHKQHEELTVMQADPQERSALLSVVPPARAAEMRFILRSFEDIDTSIEPPPTEFTYPVASPRLTAILFWACAICTLGMLLPILRGGITDWSSAGILLVLAAIFFVAALGYRITHRWAGTRLRVAAEGLTELAGNGSRKHIAWTQVAAVRYRRWIGVLDYQAAGGEQIRVGLTLKDFAHFVQLALIHLHRRSGASAT